MDGEACPKGVENEQRIVALERDMHEMKEAVTDIRDKLLGRLPVWATLLVSFLSMVVAGLVVALLRR